jgi:hypothetical protein
VNESSSPLDKYLHTDQKLAAERFRFHRAHPEASCDEYRENQRRAIRERIQSKRVIYLDTNAWKCLSDYKRTKTTLTSGMVSFAQTMNSESVRSRCVFPIGVATLFELQSMNDPVSLSTLAELVDTFSNGIGCTPPNEVLEQEIMLFNDNASDGACAEIERFCHPVEIAGTFQADASKLLLQLFPNLPPQLVPELFPQSEMVALAKTGLDIVYALPTSVHLEMAAAKMHPGWDNEEGINEMNDGMLAHQHEIENYPDALCAELAGVLRPHVLDGPPIVTKFGTFPPSKTLALKAMLDWQDRPGSRHLVTARISAHLHATVRYIANRKFRKGDVADFITAQIALSSAHALFTDKALASLLNEPHIGLEQFCSCEVVSGFDNFAAYLQAL